MHLRGLALRQLSYLRIDFKAVAIRCNVLQNLDFQILANA